MATQPALERPAGRGWGWLLIYGIVSAIFGILAFLWPFSATFAAALIVGIFFMASGIISIASGIFAGPRPNRWYAILFGIVSVIVGAIMAFEPMTGAFTITLFVAIWLATRGILELMWGIRNRDHRGAMIALGLVNIVLALLVFAWLPSSALTLPGYILGISFLVAGVVEIVRAANHRRGASAFAIP